MRSRTAAYAAGSVREYRPRDGCTSIESLIPGTRLTATVEERPSGRIRGFLRDRDEVSKPPKNPRLWLDLSGDFNLAIFMHEWDVALMRRGLIGFYPACLLEFLDRLIFDERDAAIGSLAPGVLARRALAFPWKPTWTASEELATLAEECCEDASVGATTRRAAEHVRRYISTEEDVPFDVGRSRARWVGQVMRMMLSSGRAVASPMGVWREAIGKDTTRLATWLMCRELPDAQHARRLLDAHVGALSRAYKYGGCDHFVLMNGEEPIAVATVTVDGKVSSVTKPGLFPSASGNPITTAEERLVSATR